MSCGCSHARRYSHDRLVFVALGFIRPRTEEEGDVRRWFRDDPIWTSWCLGILPRGSKGGMHGLAVSAWEMVGYFVDQLVESDAADAEAAEDDDPESYAFALQGDYADDPAFEWARRKFYELSCFSSPRA